MHRLEAHGAQAHTEEKPEDRRRDTIENNVLH